MSFNVYFLVAENCVKKDSSLYNNPIIHLFIKDLFSNDVDFTKQLKSIEKNVRSFPELSETITNIKACY
jgi:hypothetical protein